MTNFSQNLQLPEPVPLDPAVKNQWGALWDTALDMVDQAVTGDGVERGRAPSAFWIVHGQPP